VSRTEYGGGPERPRVSSWAVGGLTFAGAMLVLIGSFQFLAGLAAIINDELFDVGREYAFDLDPTVWGWIHLIVGVLMLVTGFGIFAARAWAGVIALFLAMVSALANFLYIPYYPWWALLIIALDAWVIWSLTRPGAVQT
jgi:hypothetical protein